MATSPNSEMSAATAHKVLISLGVILVVSILLVEIAGTGKNAGTAVLFFLIGVLMLLGISQSGRFAQFASKYPWNPNQKS